MSKKRGAVHPPYRYEGLGLLLNLRYVHAKPTFLCPGHAFHGNGLSNSNDQCYCDYTVGWYACTDQPWPQGGVHFRRADGTTYTAPNSGWSTASTFCPTMYQYSKEMMRRHWGGAGSRLLVVDTKAKGWCSCWGPVGGPTDIPHGNIANVLLTDYSVQSLSNGFDPAIWLGDANQFNDMVHQWPYTYWWAWAEDQVKQ